MRALGWSARETSLLTRVTRISGFPVDVERTVSTRQFALRVSREGMVVTCSVVRDRRRTPPLLLQELEKFPVKATVARNEAPESWREG
jgi:hypothetical protein